MNISLVFWSENLKRILSQRILSKEDDEYDYDIITCPLNKEKLLSLIQLIQLLSWEIVFNGCQMNTWSRFECKILTTYDPWMTQGSHDRLCSSLVVELSVVFLYWLDCSHLFFEWLGASFTFFLHPWSPFHLQFSSYNFFSTNNTRLEEDPLLWWLRRSDHERSWQYLRWILFLL